MKRQFWSPQVRLVLTLGLVILPAAALVWFGFDHLHSIEREHTVQAAIHSEVQMKLAIFDKQLSERAYELADPVRLRFPSPEDENLEKKLDAILAANPWASCAFVYDQSANTVMRLGPQEADNPEVVESTEKFARTIHLWFSEEGEAMLMKMRRLEKSGDPPYVAFSGSQDIRKDYQSMLFFPVNAAPKDRVVIGGIMFDPPFLKQFLPESLNAILADPGNHPKGETGPQAAIMLHYAKENTPVAASSGWDGGPPEVEHKVEGAFPDLIIAIRYPGTTIEAITQRFLRTSYIILGSLSVLLIAGLFFTYRGVSRTVELAKLKSDIVSNVSHELRTPLALIRLYAETLELGRIPTRDEVPVK